ncbi:acetyltransferase component of pyruvate dehydrogenase complex [Acrocarpospora pleiomorpha]|uniref:Dihydrolipoamide acetyltransferase component of pyruvate dehydrogenase complex n=1 Tax=Acrocarpospora pleiomorpha TaxID=90975 RepID=A0A5M3XQU9_9ACTN|nr:dihydrolipoamide acetyltransferase family protein [Acrocarpospora pleiomorpha]GES21543.1 acetyltransferase component of pyruvate dehydrogenase complex [Acrocarpospora pleiomorpha]
MATLLRMPEVAAGATEAVLSDWLVDENASFTTGQPIAVIETDKAVVEIEAETDAVLLRRLAEGGASVEVGSPMALIGDESEKNSDLDRILAELGAGSPREAPPPVRHEVPAVPLPVASAVPPAAQKDGRLFITPIARKILADAGLRAEDVQGTGPNGRILRRDVERAVATSREQAAPSPAPEPAVATGESAQPARASQAAAAPGLDFEEIPHSRLRRAIAGRLTASKQTIPHFYLRRTARIDALLALRSQLNDVSPCRISVNDLVLRAVAIAHVEVPDANVIWTEQGMRRFESVDIGVAIASERGLVTPVLRGVQNAAPSAVARQVGTYVRQANDGKLRQSDLEGGSISVTNLGMFGVDEFAAIINPPQSAILAVGAGKAVPVVAGGAVEVGTVMSLVLSVDHRAIDGALAAKWMAALVTSIEEPLRLLA